MSHFSFEPLRDNEKSLEDRIYAFFNKMGVAWPEGWNIVADKESGEITFTNTSENLDKLERLIRAFWAEGVPMPNMPAVKTGPVSFYDAVKTVSESAGVKFTVDGAVVVFHP